MSNEVAMPPRVLKSIDDLKLLAGQEMGTSDWLTITQERIDAFAQATGDLQWIHCDPDRAAAESPFGATIAHGFLTLSLGPSLMDELFRLEGARLAINYGLNRVRYPAAVRVGSRLRLRLSLLDVQDIPDGIQATFQQTFEVDGQEKPVCVAETVLRWLK
jgi:acyl dehydratase